MLLENEYVLAGVQNLLFQFIIATMKKTSCKPHRFEPLDMQWDEEHLKCAQLLKNVGWFIFFEKITGYNVEVFG